MLKNSGGNNNSNNNFSIINISSVHESLPQPASVPYSASKGGMQMFTRTVALDVAERGIRVNGIAPGTIDTDVNKDVLDDEYKKKNKKSRIYRCIGSENQMRWQRSPCFWPQLMQAISPEQQSMWMEECP
jgi:NAD(P)-dependent dehydrogenase (short-subunit alcohol dehydrogenase family)